MMYEKLICIDGDNGRLKVNEIYIARKFEINHLLIGVYDDKKKPVGVFPYRMFKKIEVLREERLNDVLNER